ncbi:MAG: hypothetical protein JWQ01_1895 [Massilia sp.]|nr:hypothetical protein [Massilia sp.]
MNTLTESPEITTLAPVPAHQRIEALDAVRGFALIGICLMNIEFFNRALSGLGAGMPPGLTGIDWLASYFVAYFVAGKFWTIFSLLFGMGFAVMLTRAERAGRGFLKPYIRRIAALAVFGALHHIFLFGGDILFSYAVAASFLLVVLYGTWKWMLVAIAACIGIAFIPGFGPGAGGVAGTLAFSGLIAVYMRSEQKAFGLSAMAACLLAASLIAGIAALVFWFLPSAPKGPRGPATAMCCLFLLLSFLAQKFRDPIGKRPLRAGVTIYMFFATMMTIGGLVEYLTPPEPVAVAAQAAPTQAAARLEAKKKAEAAAERAKNQKKQEEQRALETRVMSTGSYADVVRLRAAHFAEHAPNEAGFATLLIGMFLLGTWFVRSGVMENTGAHLPMFRKLAFIGLPAGIALGMLGSLIATTHLPGAQQDGFFLAHAILTIGNLPACLGYMAMIVLMLHSRSPLSKVKILAPFGRMALTNYLLQSLVMSTVFLGYGLGYWGLGRAWQVLFALGLCALQIAFSHWWLARFRYGPAEWLWRAVTYMQVPAMRVDPARQLGLPTIR